MRISLFIFITVLFSCASNNEAEMEPAPADIIPIEVFSTIMTDVHLLEAVSNQKMLREDDPTVMTAEYYEQVFVKHNISRETFEKSYNYWASRPDNMMVIYDQVINNLTKMEEEAGGKELNADQ